MDPQTQRAIALTLNGTSTAFVILANCLKNNGALDPEQIEDGKHGILIKPGDTDLLAKKIEFLLDNPDMGKTYAKNAYSRLKSKFTLENMIKSYDELIKETIKEKL